MNGFKEGDILTRYDGVRRVVSGAHSAASPSALPAEALAWQQSPHRLLRRTAI